MNITRFTRAGSAIEFEVERGSDVALRRGWEMRDGERRNVGGVLTLDEAREEQVRLIGEGYRPVVVERGARV